MTTGAYYALRPAIPRWIQIKARRLAADHLRRKNQHCWPITEAAGTPPPDWPGWPGGKRFGVVLTHDVELQLGVSRCEQLARSEVERGLRSSFGFVPLRYETPLALRNSLVESGHEVMVHDLYHDGKLFRNWRTFGQRFQAVNEFLRSWQTRGFSSGSMHHNLPWMSRLNIDYSISTYDVDPFEPQSCGSGRIFPYWVHSTTENSSGFVELPYTLPQDFTTFVLLGEQNNAIWRRKLDWIAEKGGMALIKTHPDYMVFPHERKRIDGYPVELYTDFLDYLTTRYSDDAWFAQPSEVARFWRSLKLGSPVNPIAWRQTFCPSCRQAHAQGWLTESPRDSVEPEPASAPSAQSRSV